MTTTTNLKLAAIVASLALLSGCAATATAAPAPEPTPVVERAHSEAVERPTYSGIAVVGDSITAWSPPFANDPGQSWVYTATSNDLPLVGGWALPGAQLDAMLANVQPSPTAEWLLIMGGTNDMYYRVPIETRLALIDQIVEKVGAHRVVLSTVAPYNPEPWLAGEWNGALAAHAAERGWSFIDPWSNVRDGEVWAAGADYGDGVHPSPASAVIIGTSIKMLLETL